MANKLVYSWADKLWHMSPPRNYIATRWQQGEKPTAHLSTFGFLIRRNQNTEKQKSLNFSQRSKKITNVNNRLFKINIMKKATLLLALFYSTFIFSQNFVKTWQQCYGGSDDDKVRSIIPYKNGYIFFGTTQSNDGDITKQPK